MCLGTLFSAGELRAKWRPLAEVTIATPAGTSPAMPRAAPPSRSKPEVKTPRGARCIRLARSADSSGRRCPGRRPSRRACASRSRPYSRKACCGDCRLPGSRNRRFGRRKRGLRAAPLQVQRRPSSSLRRGELSFSWERPLVVVLTQLDSPDKGFIPPRRDSNHREHLAARTYGQQPGGL
jgi:hypothetical protein